MRSEEEMCGRLLISPKPLPTPLDRQTLQRNRASWRIFPAAVPDRDMSTEDYLVKRAKEGLKSVWPFYSLTRKNVLSAARI
ncbi:hypothetical protein ACNKHT_01275 [Shigella flexneri]